MTTFYFSPRGRKLRQFFSTLILLSGFSGLAQAPTVDSFSPTVITARTPVTINGNNFSNATAVSFGGTSAASFTIISNTKIIAIPGLGASGTVRVANSFGTGIGGNATYITAAPTPATAGIDKIITDFNVIWSSTEASSDPAKQPDSRHNLLGFSNNGTLYTTGVSDLTIVLNLNLFFDAGDYRALPIGSISGNTTGSQNFLAFGTKVDGNATAANYLSPEISTLKVKDVLTDGVKGLDLGTGVTNISNSMLLEYYVSNISNAAINDSKPDILISQIANPSNIADIYVFTDSNGNVIGNPVQANLSLINAVGTSKLDLFTLPSNTAYADATPMANGSTGTRDIRMMALKLSDFGITTANAASITKLKMLPGGDSDPAFIAYNAAAFQIPIPVIVSQPVSVAVCPNQVLFGGATFSVTATGTGLSYQWQKNGVNISGATSSVYNISAVTEAHAGAYTVVVSNAFGSVTSAPAYLNTTVVLQPVAATVCINSPVMLGTFAGGLNMNYRWYSNTANNTTTGTAISGATAANYQPPTNTAGVMYYYAVVKANNLNCLSTTTKAVAVTVNPLSVGGTAAVSRTICSGTATTLSLSGQTGSIQWQQSTNGTSGWANVTNGSGSATANYTTSALTTPTYFRAAVTSGECATAFSNVIAIGITPASNAGTVTANHFICTNTTATLSTTGFTGDLQWQQSADGITIWSNAVGGSGATTATFTTPALTAARFYRVAATNSSCAIAYSTVISVGITTLPNAGTASGNQTICFNNTATIHTTGTVGTIQWQQSVDGINGWANVTNGSGSATANYTTPALTATTYYRAVVENGNCTDAISATTTVNVNHNNTWTGNVNSDWSLAANWSCLQVPTVVIDVNIPTVVSGNYPDVTTATVWCRNLSIDSGASLKVSGSAAFEIAGTVSSNGVFDVKNGSVRFIGASPQQIPANVFASNSIQNLTINNPAGVSMQGANNLTGILDVKSGNFQTGNYLTLKSNAQNTAIIAPVTGSVTGTMTIERFIPARRAFRFLSSPTDGGTIRSNWQENGTLPDPVGLGTDITGIGGATNGFDVSGSNNPSLYTYLNHNTTGGTSWIAATTTTTNMVAGMPYRMMVRGDRTVNQSSNSAPSSDTTLRTGGTIRTGEVTVTDLNPVAGGFSFIGNPYQAPVDMGLLLNDASLLDTNFYYVWDAKSNTQGSYVTVNLTDGDNSVFGSQADRFLQPGQACFVKTTTAGQPSLVFKENYKHLSTVNVPIFKTSEETRASLRVTLYETAALALNAMPADGFVVKFDTAYSNEVNAFDASKPSNQDEHMGTMNSGKVLSYESRNLPTGTDVVPISLIRYRNTNYTFKILINNITSARPYLKDKYTGTKTALSEGENSYAFSVNQAVAASIETNRFDVVFEENVMLNIKSSDILKSAQIYPNPVTENQFFIKLPATTQVNAVKIINVLGQEVYGVKPVLKDGLTEIKPNTILKSGIYMVSIDCGKNIIKQKVIVK